MDREALLKGLTPEREVELSAGTVRVRGLTRAEVTALAPLKDDLPDLERSILLLGFVDPVLSEEDIAVWYATAANSDVDRAVTAISEATGMAPDSPKSGVPGLRDGGGA